MSFATRLVVFLVTCSATLALAQPKPIIIGFDSEAGHATSTSDDAIRAGMNIAIEEINAKGGVLGRRLEIEERDNRSVPARGVANAKAFAENPDVVAFLSGKFSPVVLEQLKFVQESGLILLDPWAAADDIIENGFKPSFIFRLSLSDSIAIAALLQNARNRGLKKVGVFAPNTGWGRSSLQAAERFAAKNGMKVVSIQWHNWGVQNPNFVESFRKIRAEGADFVLMVANEVEGAALIKNIAAAPKADRLPVLSHWGVLGGDFPAMAGPALQEVDLRIVTTISYKSAKTRKGRELLEKAALRLNIPSPSQITSAVGVVHAYDLVHVLALAIGAARSTDRAKVRSELEKVKSYDGAIKRFNAVFTATRHEALAPEDLNIVRFDTDGTLIPAVDNIKK